MKIRSLAALSASLLVLSACDGLKEALTAHVDVVARAEGQELSVTRLGDLLGNSRLQIPVTKETAGIVTDLWVNYHLLALAAARGDSLTDTTAIDEAAKGITGNVRLRRFMEKVGTGLSGDSASEATYTQATGGILAARHILIGFPGGPGTASQAQKDSLRRRAEQVRAQVTNANFAQMVSRHSTEPGAGQRGGDLGAFARDDMVKPFSDAVAALRPGEISNPVETQFGYHIIQRYTYGAAKAMYDPVFSQRSGQRAESLYVAKVDADANIQVKSNAPALAKAAARDVAAHRRNSDVMATFRNGDLTVAEFVRWVEAFPPQMRITGQMAQAPDSIVRQFVKSMARNEVLLVLADSAGVTLGAEERGQLHGEFRTLITGLWEQLGIAPQMLADSARSVPERERLAATRVEAILDRIMGGQAQPLSVPVPVQMVLTSKYESKINPAGLDRAVEQARKLRSVADSARSANQPASQVPLPTAPAPAPDSAAARRP
jgi:hypothetical protein